MKENKNIFKKSGHPAKGQAQIFICLLTFLFALFRYAAVLSAFWQHCPVGIVRSPGYTIYKITEFQGCEQNFMDNWYRTIEPAHTIGKKRNKKTPGTQLALNNETMVANYSNLVAAKTQP